MTKAILALEDGTIFRGNSVGARGEAAGEIVFNTSMTGYQEILTDPSYKGQIITFTYPHIGNYGINAEDIESDGPKVAGIAAKEFSKVFSSWRGKETIGDYLTRNKIVGIEGIDTRGLVIHIRSKGAMKSIISTERFEPKELVDDVRKSPGISERDLVAEVSCKKAYSYNKNGKFNVVVMDFGVKRNILRNLAAQGCRLTVVPATTAARDILKYKPDGIVFSNGPGDPAAAGYAIRTVRDLLESGFLQNGGVIMGICLGHQLIGLAQGAKTYKLKFGHRGANQPAKNLETGKVSIVSENHGFSVDISSINSNFKATFINLNDGTLEGMRHKTLPLFSVQFHPEASPGPHDTSYVFGYFFRCLKETI